MAHDIDSASLHRIHTKRNKTKMFRNALGFLQGIVADNQVNPLELQALHTYMLDCAEHMAVVDILACPISNCTMFSGTPELTA